MKLRLWLGSSITILGNATYAEARPCRTASPEFLLALADTTVNRNLLTSNGLPAFPPSTRRPVAVASWPRGLGREVPGQLPLGARGYDAARLPRAEPQKLARANSAPVAVSTCRLVH